MKSKSREKQGYRTPSRNSNNESHDDTQILSSIFASPTVDTLETTRTFTPISSIRAAESPVPMNNRSMMSQSSTTRRNASFASNQKKKKSQQPRDFQYKQDAMSVSVRTLDLTTRTAFEPLPPASIEEWHRVCAQAEKMKGGNVSMKKRLSPSLQHLELLHRLQGITSIRQLSFSPSVGMDSDIFVPWDDDIIEDGRDLNEANKKASRNKRSKNRRDGRYRSINPIQATMAVLPPNTPTLSHHKLRLPMRSDVGFPNASEEEIRQKQMEIAKETEWEEASPRLVVLVTGDDLGTAIQDVPSAESLSELHREWNGGGLEGMPLAGRELIIAKERNSRYFGGRNGKGPARNKKLLEPDRTSVLAPPLESTYSSSLGWRPRPFLDHPPGTVHCLACPIQVEFDVGDIEPLVGSLALYSLPVSDLSRERNAAYGKMSEEFYFPVGDWTDRVDLDAARTVDGRLDPELVNEWFQRKHKALFSFDPLSLNGCETETLHVVLQIFKVAQKNPASAYLAKGDVQAEVKAPFQKRRSIGKRIRSKFGKIAKSTGEEPPVDAPTTKASADDIFSTFGTQLLSPLCFGVCRLYPAEGDGDLSFDPADASESSGMVWPAGAAQMIDLFSFPSCGDTQEDFVERLLHVVTDGQSAGSRTRGDEYGFRPASPDGSQEDAANWPQRPVPDSRSSSPMITPLSSNASSSSLTDNATPLKAKTQVRSRTPPIIQPQDRSWKSRGLKSLEPSHTVAGTATLFTSRIGADFTQAMLQTPAVLEAFEGKAEKLPRLLVDSSGCCAVMVKPSAPNPAVFETPARSSRKRSDLIRLPPSLKTVGYADASEVRELLYLPPRLEKQHDVDTPPSHRSFVNLLFMYPRSLKLASDVQRSSEGARKAGAYSIRIQLVRSSVDIDGETGQVESFQTALESFYNPAPWAGPQMLKAVYTKVMEAPRGKRPIDESLQKGISMRDEIKLRLPRVIDGNYYLHFTLFGLNLDDRDYSETTGSVALDSIAETTIPLTSSSTREANSGVRVTTIIPNGNHRLKLGQFQLQLETRLVSSVHVGDTAVATALRDFPFKTSDSKLITDGFPALALIPSRSIVGRSSMSSDPIVDLKVPFSTVFAAASENTLFVHVHALAHMHFSNLVSRATGVACMANLMHDKEDRTILGPDARFLIDNTASLFEIFRKAKIRLYRHGSPANGLERVAGFAKDFVDCFDEQVFSQRDEFRTVPSEAVKREKGIPVGRSRSSFSIDIVTTETDMQVTLDEDDDAFNDGGGSLRKGRRSLGKETSPRSAALEAAGLPFARVAYGASKIDRMRLEAEINNEGARYTQLFDDDETIATFLTVGNGTLRPGESDSRAENKAVSNSTDDEKWLRANSTDNSVAEQATNEPGLQDRLGFAKRVRTAAQVMIAPCVAPDLSTALANSGVDSRLKGALSGLLPQKEKSEHESMAHTTKEPHIPFDETIAEPVAYPGSDVDDDSIVEEKAAHQLVRSRSGAVAGVLRPPVQEISMPLTIAPSSGSTRATSFVYEVLIIVWLDSWAAARRKESFVVFPPFGQEGSKSDLFLVLAAHLDLALPLCLKSFLLRCSSSHTDKHDVSNVVMDDEHMHLFEAFFKMLAQVLVGQGLYGPNNSKEAELSMLRALLSTKYVIDFWKGMASTLHPFQLSILLSTLIVTLREGEIEMAVQNDGQDTFVWDSDSLRRVHCSRQIRLRIVEQVSVMPNFVALNFPCRYNESGVAGRPRATSWNVQASNSRESSDHSDYPSVYIDGQERLPKSGWLAELLTGDCLSICSLSCEAVVAEAIAQLESSQQHDATDRSPSAEALRKRPGAALQRDDLLRFQATAIHAVNCVYELLLRRHAMDGRFQTEQARCRIAALFAPAILEKSLSSVRWLARMEATHKVRSVWLLCFIYVLQEAPEALIRAKVRSFCATPGFQVHKFIRLLRLCTSSFQCFADIQHKRADINLSPWILQECFNTISSTLNVIVDESVRPLSPYPKEERRMAQGILDLLLHIITAPQSVVTHLRAVGGALHTMTRLGVDLFLEVAGTSLQHWVRVILTLLNSSALSVRSIAVDFVISLLGDCFKSLGNVDKITEMFATLIPEVVAREIALYSVNGLIDSVESVEKAVWPLRRALADIEEASPVDDDRVDPQLSPILSVFCRACQAIIDGVLLELRLQGNGLRIAGTRLHLEDVESFLFDADEESLFEAASFFVAETAPLQKLRWLLTLKTLHEANKQWVEAAETLILCARTISDSLPHLRSVWRPSRFVLWHDSRRSLWLSNVGENMGLPDRGNAQVMEFADNFLEPLDFLGIPTKKDSTGKLPPPDIQLMCDILISVTNEAVQNYKREGGMEDLAMLRLEGLLRIVMKAIDEHHGTSAAHGPQIPITMRRRLVEESASLQEVSTHLNGELTSLSMSLLDISSRPTNTLAGTLKGTRERKAFEKPGRLYYVRVLVSGRKPDRFKESTTIPTFLEWGTACICRVPNSVVKAASAGKKSDPSIMEERICHEYGKPLRDALVSECPKGSVLFRTAGRVGEAASESDATTFLDISMVYMGMPPDQRKLASKEEIAGPRESKRFYYRKSSSSETIPGTPLPGEDLPELSADLTSNLVELRVAQQFPCALSRQRALITSEFVPSE